MTYLDKPVLVAPAATGQQALPIAAREARRFASLIGERMREPQLFHAWRP